MATNGLNMMTKNKGERTALGFMQVGLHQQTSANCKSKLLF